LTPVDFVDFVNVGNVVDVENVEDRDDGNDVDDGHNGNDVDDGDDGDDNNNNKGIWGLFLVDIDNNVRSRMDYFLELYSRIQSMGSISPNPLFYYQYYKYFPSVYFANVDGELFSQIPLSMMLIMLSMLSTITIEGIWRLVHC
jgi:hypothetical protein